MTDLEEVVDDPIGQRYEANLDEREPKEQKGQEKKGKLLDLPPEKAAKEGVRLWKEDEGRHKKLRVRWKANKLRRMGIVGVQVRAKDQDETAWTLYAPPSTEPLQSLPNKARRLCRRLTSHMFVDPPEPEATPRTDEEADIASAELASRVLSTEGDDSGINVTAAYRRAFSLACTYGSGFVRFYVDPYAGGFRPKTVRASNAAPVGTPEEQAVDVDGATYPGHQEYLTRYVTAQGTITDNPGEAVQQWLPKLKREVLTGIHVRLDPPHCEGVSDADGIHIGLFRRVSEIKALFPKHPVWKSDERLRKMCAFRPENPSDLLPPARREELGSSDEKDRVKDTALVFVHTHYYKACHRYPEGAYAVFGGGSEVFERTPWIEEMEDGTTAPMDIPIAQIPQFRDEDEGDLAGPYAIGAMDLLGGINDARGETIVTMLEHLDRYRNRKVFYPLTSALQPKQMQAPSGTYLPINPGGEPKYEDMGEDPKIAIDLFEHLTLEMDDESGLQQLAQGLSSPEVGSGFHATQVVEQAAIGLSDLQQNLHDAYKRGWRIMLQLIRQFYSIEQQIRYLGDDSEFKAQAFVGTDLGSTRDVLIAKGSGTLLSPSAKAAQAEHLATTGLIDAFEFRRMISHGLGGSIGMQDNPHFLRIMRQITRWHEGVPPELIAQAEQEKAAMLAGQVPPPPMEMDPATGAPLPPMDPVTQAVGAYGAEVFERRAVDLLPEVAMTRLEALGRALASSKYAKHPPPWQDVITAEFEEMRVAAAVMTTAEQSMMAAEADAQAMASGAPGNGSNGKAAPKPPAAKPPRVPGSASTPTEAAQSVPVQ